MTRNLPAIIITALLLLAIACSNGDDGDGLTIAPPPTATAAPFATPVVTVSPTSVSQPPRSETPIPPTSTAAPTQTPAAALSPSPTPSATPVPDLAFYFGDAVSLFEQTLIITAVEVVRDLLAETSQVAPPVSVFASPDLQALADDFERHARAQAWRSQRLPERLQGGVAEASYRSVIVNTGSEAWAALNDSRQMRAVAHEYVHVIQLEKAGQNIADATLRAPSGAVPPAGPYWLLEGSAEVVSYLVLEQLDLGNYTETVIDLGIGLRGQERLLPELESHLGYTSAGEDGTAWSTLAVDYILRARGLDDLFGFWDDINAGSRWQDAFVRRVGMTPRQYYDVFDTYYNVTFGE